ncbi:UDP-glycosyltransferase 85A5 [Dendrobium catenatum]|uniref:UDP-glycosyltransferase 85A5 n=1 Tax=Dendrobium catenatum TaxID=906689 RepID=A0A2I0VVK3_9ASPA|nr:UDP-glycosyltransferase 85A5 [Dendrobium catenatum]
MEMADENQQQEAHVLIFPCPLQGHITAMLRLAEALSFADGFIISFLNTEHNNRLLNRFSLRPNFRFLSIPDGLPEDCPRSLPHITELLNSLRTHSIDYFHSLLLAGGRRDPNGWPPVTCLIVDGVLPFAMDAAQALGIPVIVFQTISASALWICVRFPQMIQAGELPFPGGRKQIFSDADLDELIKSVPAMESYLRRRDLPSMCRKATEAEDEELQLFANISATSMRSKALIINSSNSLEASILSRIRSISPNTYAVGPLHAVVESITSSSISSSLLGEDCSALSWLDSQPDRALRRLYQLWQPRTADAGRVSGVVARVRRQRSPVLVGGKVGLGGWWSSGVEDGRVGGENKTGGVGATGGGPAAPCGGLLLYAQRVEFNVGECSCRGANGVLAEVVGSVG